MELSDRHERFCQEYQLDCNASQAAARAGYSKRTSRITGQRLLAREDVQARLTQLQRERAARTQVEADQVLMRLQNVAERCQAEIPIYSPDGEEVGTRLLNAAGAIRALELLGKHLGLWVDRQQIVSDSEQTITLDWTCYGQGELNRPEEGRQSLPDGDDLDDGPR